MMANNRRGSEKLEASVLFCNFVHAAIQASCLTLYQHSNVSNFDTSPTGIIVSV